MGKADGNPGLSKLARVMSNRMREFSDQTAEDVTPDFGVINKNTLRYKQKTLRSA